MAENQPVEKELKKKTCDRCMFAFLVDYGYSNYTVEGTNFYCGINKHPDGPFDQFYGGDKRLGYASDCQYFAKGHAVKMDVDRDNLVEQKMTPAQLILWRHRVKNAHAPPDRKRGEGE